MKRRYIRASEVAEYLFCAQAWWFRRQGIPPRGRERLRAGWEAHRAHGRRVTFWLRWQRRARYLLWSALLLWVGLVVWYLLVR